MWKLNLEEEIVEGEGDPSTKVAVVVAEETTRKNRCELVNTERPCVKENGPSKFLKTFVNYIIHL